MEAFPTPQQFHRHWEQVHPDAESSCSSSEDSSAAGSGSDITSGGRVSSAVHGGASPGDDECSETHSDQPSSRGLSHGANGEEVAEQGEVLDAGGSGQAVAPAPDSHPGTDLGDALAPEQREGDFFYDAVRPTPPPIV